MFSLPQLLTYVFIMDFTPGPNNIMSMSNAGRYGLKKSIRFNFGIYAGFTIVMALSALFGNALGKAVPNLAIYMKLLGAGYMLYLAWSMARSTGDIGDGNENAGTFAAGFALQFMNPKGILYCITVMATYVTPYFSSVPVLLGFALLLSTISFMATLCWALFGVVFKKVFTKHARLLNISMALLLVYCAVRLFV